MGSITLRATEIQIPLCFQDPEIVLALRDSPDKYKSTVQPDGNWKWLENFCDDLESNRYYGIDPTDRQLGLIALAVARILDAYGWH